MQIKTTMRYHLTPIRMTIIKKSINKCWRKCKEKGIFLHIHGNVNWYSHYVKQYGGCKQTKLNIELPYDPASPLLGIYPEKNMAGNDTFTSLFIAPLFTIAKTWKQPKHSSTDEWIKKIWCIHTMEYYSPIKKNEITPFAATWMDLETVLLSDVRKTNIV